MIHSRVSRLSHVEMVRITDVLEHLASLQNVKKKFLSYRAANVIVCKS
jgi:hypothetical protein